MVSWSPKNQCGEKNNFLILPGPMPGPYFIFDIVYQSVFDSTESNTKWFAEGLPLKAWGLKLSLKVWILKVLNWKIQQSKIHRVAAPFGNSIKILQLLASRHNFKC